MALLILIAIIFFSWIVWIFVISFVETKKEKQKLQQIKKPDWKTIDEMIKEAGVTQKEIDGNPELHRYLFDFAKNLNLKKINIIEQTPFPLKKAEKVYFKFENVGADFIARGYKFAKTDTWDIHWGSLYITSKRFVFVGNYRIVFDVQLKYFGPNINTLSMEAFIKNQNLFFYFLKKEDFFKCFLIWDKVLNNSSFEDIKEELADSLDIEI